MSSLRVAVGTGLALGTGGSVRSQGQNGDRETQFKPHVIPPDEEYLALRSLYARAIADNRKFWQAELACWTEALGEDATRKLREFVDG